MIMSCLFNRSSLFLLPMYLQSIHFCKKMQIGFDREENILRLRNHHILILGLELLEM